MKMTDYIDMGEQYILHTYNRFPVVFEKGDGVYLYDVNQNHIWILRQELRFLPWDITIRRIMTP